ncbi:MAG: hypothetical protein DCC58_01695 [Chloroflexi bacterium]|nr:MAG: hypothetical protein DCC58_01695 [Chloroflexota bacterium]
MRRERTRQHPPTVVPVEALHDVARPASTAHPLAQVQLSAHSPASAVEGIQAQVVAGGGQPLETAVRTRMERAFNHQFSHVRIHADSNAGALSRTLNADALTTGRDVFFGEGRYRPGTLGGERLLAHELAHVVQQGSPGAAPQVAGVGPVGDAAEQRAEQAAAHVARGGPAPAVGAAPAGVVQRAVKTNGGEFDTTTYAAFGGGASTAGTRVGADIDITFKPNELVEANTIGLTQTVKTMRSLSAGGAVNDPKNARTIPSALTPADGPGVDVGRGIDRTDFTSKRNPDGTSSTLPNTNPMYGVHNTPADPTASPPKPAGVSATLSDTAPGSTASFGSRKKKPDGAFEPPVNATLSDSPRRGLEFDGQEWTQSFETTALILDGPMANTWLGSVEWGWKSDATGTVTLNPATLRLVRAGTPTTAFMDAARKWNSMTITDPTTGTSYNTVDLPATFLSSGTKAAPDMTTKELLTALAAVNSDQGVLGVVQSIPGAAGMVANDVTNKNFEKRALEEELKKRKVKIDVKVNSTEDWLGSDEVYVRLTGPGGGVHKTAVHDLNDGQSYSFLAPLEKIVPLSGPIKVEVFDEDSPDGDDLIVTMDWSPPFDEAKNTASLDDANYDVTVTFET